MHELISTILAPKMAPSRLLPIAEITGHTFIGGKPVEFWQPTPRPEPRPDRRDTVFAGLAERFSVPTERLVHLASTGECVTGFATGGSESLVLFFQPPEHVTGGATDIRVRKVWNEGLISADWDRKGTGVMAPPLEKAKLQNAFLQGLPEAAREYFPRIHAVGETITFTEGPNGTVPLREITCDQEFIEGAEVSAVVRDLQPAPEVVAQLHREILRCLRENVHPHRRTEPSRPVVEEMYLDKIVNRLNLAQRTAPQTFTPLLLSDTIQIDGEEYMNIGPLLEDFRKPEFLEKLEPSVLALVMGDTNTENVKITKPEVFEALVTEGRTDFTYDDIGIKFLDPRAIGFDSEGATTVDDIMYDNKPIHNSLGNYDMIHAEHFDINVGVTEQGVPSITVTPEADHPFIEPYRDMEQHFGYIMDGLGVNEPDFQELDPNWLLRFTFIMGSHFAAMPPFHFSKNYDRVVEDHPQEQKRAVAIYAEGIKWLNRAHDIMTGKRTELYGVAVPPTSVVQTSNR